MESDAPASFTAVAQAAQQILQLAFGFIFLVSAADKWLRWEGFKAAVAGYRLVPAAVAPLGAGAIGILETLVGLGLASGISRRLSIFGGALLLSFFALAIAINLLRGRTNIDCGCSVASRGQQLEWRLVARNLICAAVLIATAPATRSGAWAVALPPALGLCLSYYAVSGVWSSASFQRQLRRI